MLLNNIHKNLYSYLEHINIPTLIILILILLHLLFNIKAGENFSFIFKCIVQGLILLITAHICFRIGWVTISWFIAILPIIVFFIIFL